MIGSVIGVFKLNDRDRHKNHVRVKPSKHAAAENDAEQVSDPLYISHLLVVIWSFGGLLCHISHMQARE